MIAEHPSAKDPVRTLLALLKNPEAASSLNATDWDGVIRTARAAGVLARLNLRLGAGEALETVPEQVRLHLDSGLAVASHRRQMVLWELERVARALARLATPIVLLKGSAYIAQGFAFAAGRMPSDVDIMVPRAHLDRTERALLEAGWQGEELDPYDEHYYRAWSHELPPMRFPEHPLELDLHHTILPLTGRAQPNAHALFEAAVPVAGTRFHVLCPADQVLHACSQLFQDSDCAGRLRDLMDIDSLIREVGATEPFWERLLERTRLHGFERSLFYSLRYAMQFLGTDVPEAVVQALPRPPGPGVALMDRLVGEALLPAHPDRAPSLSARLSRRMLFLRSHWLRMPPRLLARHALVKAWRSVRAPRRASVQEQ